MAELNIDWEYTILSEIEEGCSRDVVAQTYAYCIATKARFAKINRAILDRWSGAALEYIKTKAWKLLKAEDE